MDPVIHRVSNRRWCTWAAWSSMTGYATCSHVPSMPHKYNADRRHHIPKMAIKAQDWPEYETALRRRGSLTLWIEDTAADQWQTVGAAGQARRPSAECESRQLTRL